MIGMVVVCMFPASAIAVEIDFLHDSLFRLCYQIDNANKDIINALHQPRTGKMRRHGVNNVILFCCLDCLVELSSSGICQEVQAYEEVSYKDSHQRKQLSFIAA